MLEAESGQWIAVNGGLPEAVGNLPMAFAELILSLCVKELASV